MAALFLAACGGDDGREGLSIDGETGGPESETGGDGSGLEIPVFDSGDAADPEAPAGLQPGAPVELGQTADFELFSVAVTEIAPGGPVENETIFTGPDSIVVTAEMASRTDVEFAPTGFVTACADDLGLQSEPELLALTPGEPVTETFIVTISERCLGEDLVLRLPNQLPQLQVAEWAVPADALA